MRSVVLRPGFALLLTACGAQVSFNGSSEPTAVPSREPGPTLERVSLSCIATGRRAPVVVPCDGDALTGDGAFVAVWFHTSDGKRQAAEGAIALNDIELEAKQEVTIDGEVIPVFPLADAFPDVRHGAHLPPARYHVRVGVKGYTGTHTMAEQDVVIR